MESTFLLPSKLVYCIVVTDRRKDVCLYMLRSLLLTACHPRPARTPFVHSVLPATPLFPSHAHSCAVHTVLSSTYRFPFLWLAHSVPKKGGGRGVIILQTPCAKMERPLNVALPFMPAPLECGSLLPLLPRKPRLPIVRLGAVLCRRKSGARAPHSKEHRQECLCHGRGGQRSSRKAPV